MSAQPALAQSGLAHALVQAGRLRAADIEELARHAPGRPFIEALLMSSRLSALEAAEFISQTFALPLLDLDTIDADAIPIEAIDRKLIQSARVLPLRQRRNRLVIALADPTDSSALDQIKFQTGLAVESVVVEYDKLTRVLAHVLRAADVASRAYASEEIDKEPEGANSQEATPTASPTTEADEAPVMRFIHRILTDAVGEGATDLHFEPYEKSYRIRIRVDGELRELIQPPLGLNERIASRLKIMSRMDLAEKRLPQDGRFKLSLAADRAVELRVSSLPTLYGEKIVVRVLDTALGALDIDSLGYEPEQYRQVLQAIERAHGMILVTGPAGSGTTRSLYSFLQRLNRPGVNISTAEDPVEMPLAGINQVGINESSGLGFAAALRAFLHQDPDIVMIGEIRDLETAEIAVKAAQTGHLVLSGMVTRDAPSALARLANMGVASFNIVGAVNLITAQRLVRRLCECKAPVNVPEGALREAGFPSDETNGGWQQFGPSGCERCKGSGYKGRIGLFQVMPMSDALNRIVMQGCNSIEIAEQAAREGMLSLRQSGLRKVKQGVTSLEEALAATNGFS
jgi:type IV pilus assembly protein PilB